MIRIYESSGDKPQIKFVGIKTELIPGIMTGSYYSEIASYIIMHKFTDNVLTGVGDDYIEHYDIIKELPDSLKERITLDTLFIGSTYITLLKDRTTGTVLDLAGALKDSDISFIGKLLQGYPYDQIDYSNDRREVKYLLGAALWRDNNDYDL